jgi:hypothetical protein
MGKDGYAIPVMFDGKSMLSKRVLPGVGYSEGVGVVVLKRLDSGWHDVSSDTDASRAHIPFISDYPGDGRDAASSG